MKNGRSLRIMAAAVSTAMILAGIFMTLSVSDGYQRGKRKYQEWSDRYMEDTENNAEEKNDENPAGQKSVQVDELLDQALPKDAPRPVGIDFDGLISINSDVVGWIDLPAAGISYPVVQAVDNEYYLHRALDKSELFAGCLFLDAENAPGFSDDNSIIYGHNMRDGSMFAKLRDYNDQAVYEKCPYFWIYTPCGNYLYQIYSVHTAVAGTSAFLRSFNEPCAYEDWFRQMYGDSVIKTSVFSMVLERSVTLSTCTSNPQERLIVQGMCISEESPERGLKENDDRENLEVKL